MPVNNLHTEMVVQISTFFATVICHRWRIILLSESPPQLWYNTGGTSSEIQVYLKRSRCMPIVINLSSPELAELIVVHTSRLVGLTARANDSQCCPNQIAKHLRHPIPCLQTFCISTTISGLREVEFASDVRDPFVLHSKKLDFDGISLFREGLMVPGTSKTFPHITELTVRTYAIEIAAFVETLEQLPTLERLSITFAGSSWYGRSRAITLPHVQEMSVLTHKLDRLVLPVLELIGLPNVTSLHLQIPLPVSWSPEASIFPIISFGERIRETYFDP